MSSQIEIAKAIATVAHRNQSDKANAPYIDHPRRVAEIVSRIWSMDSRRDIAIATAWLHDVLEDTDITSEELIQAGVDRVVVDNVLILSRNYNDGDDYYEQIRYRPIAKTVKLADISDNTNPTRLSKLDDATIARLTRKYAKARAELGETDV